MLIAVLLLLWTYIFLIARPSCAAARIEEITFRTGDMVLFHSLDNINAMLMASYFTHVGIVVVGDDGTPLLFEAANPTSGALPATHQSGIILSDLRHRLQSYRGHAFVKQLRHDLVDRDTLMQLISYAHDKMYYDVDVVRNLVDKLILGEPLHHGTNCGELAYLALIALGVLPKKYMRDNRRYHLRWLATTDIIEGTAYRFSPIVWLRPDQFVPHPPRCADPST